MTPWLPYNEIVRLGKIEHIKSLGRRVIPLRSFNLSPTAAAGRLVSLFFKWDVHEYPGYGRILGHILGVGHDHARRLARGERVLSYVGRARLIAWLEVQAREINSILEALRDEQAALDKRNAMDPKFNPQARMNKARAARKHKPKERSIRP